MQSQSRYADVLLPVREQDTYRRHHPQIIDEPMRDVLTGLARRL